MKNIYDPLNPQFTIKSTNMLTKEINILNKLLNESYNDFGVLFNQNSELLRNVDEMKEELSSLEYELHKLKSYGTVIESTLEEFTMTEQAEVRYVHVKDIPEVNGINGYTIAYMRSESMVFFAWTEKCVVDQYEKEIGRVYSSNRLGSISMEMVDDAERNRFSIDFSQMIGVLSIEYFTDGLEAAFSDQHVSSMTMFDFKHSFLSNVMKQIVITKEL